MKKMMLIFSLILCGCTQLQRFTVSDQFVLTKQDLESEDTLILSDEKYKNTLSKNTVTNLKKTHDNMSKLTNIDFSYMILESESYSYGAFNEDEKNYVALSSSFLNEFGDDEDVINSSTLHSLSHIKNGSTDNSLRLRETSLFVVRQIVSTTVSIFATPLAGYASSAALSGAETGVKIAEENSANTVTFDWIKEGNINPCGFIKEKNFTDKNVDILTPTKYLLSHPGVDDRYKLAKEYSESSNQYVCTEHIKKEASSINTERIHEPLEESDSR